MKEAARKQNLTACLCCAKIHKKSGENLLNLVIDLSIWKKDAKKC
jgi:hypothetical protein